jgi:hypothetical protein
MLLLHEQPADFSQMSPADIEAVIAEYMAWSNNLAAQGKIRGGEKLCDEGGRHLRGFGDEFRVTDGPFVEAKEVIGGYFAIEAADYDEAVRLSSDCPHLKYGGWVELREIQPTGE